MDKKRLSDQAIEAFAEEAIVRHASEENIEFGVALRNISEDDLKKIIAGGNAGKTRKGRGIKWKERIIWSVSVAALIAVAVSVPLGVKRDSERRVDNLLFEYNVSSWDMSRGDDEVPDIKNMSEEQLKKQLARFEEAYKGSESPQDIAINGKILALTYLKLHDRKKTVATLESMIDRLRDDEDYVAVVEECRRLLRNLQ